MDEQVVATPEAPEPDEAPTHSITEADPEGDGLDKGQATADTVDALGI